FMADMTGPTNSTTPSDGHGELLTQLRRSFFAESFQHLGETLSDADVLHLAAAFYAETNEHLCVRSKLPATLLAALFRLPIGASRRSCTGEGRKKWTDSGRERRSSLNQSCSGETVEQPKLGSDGRLATWKVPPRRLGTPLLVWAGKEFDSSGKGL